MIDRIVHALGEIPDHVQALALIALGAGISIIKGQHDTGQALIAAGLAMWKGRQ